MVEFSQRSQRFQASAIRELFKLMADPEIIPLSGGSPADESFPLAEIRTIIDDLLATQGSALLQYGITTGWQPLREAYIQHLLQPKGISAAAENVIITTGSTQGIHLVCDAFLNEGDVVLVESATFLNTLNVLRKFGAQIVAVDMDDQGMCIDDLAAKVQQYHPKLLYTIPTFQNPTGRTIPLERRQAIAQLAAEYDFIVIEDDPYGDVRLEGEALPPIKYFDASGRVIMMNSFSKIIAPGLRVGAAVGTAEIISTLEVFKQGMDTHTDNLAQAVCAEFLNRGLLPAHLQRISAMYKERRDVMLSCLDTYFPASCRYTIPQGGLFLWVELPPGSDTTALLNKAVQAKVAFVPGAPFCLDAESGKRYMRLNYSFSAPEQIREALRRLGALLHDELQA